MNWGISTLGKKFLFRHLHRVSRTISMATQKCMGSREKHLWLGTLLALLLKKKVSGSF